MSNVPRRNGLVAAALIGALGLATLATVVAAGSPRSAYAAGLFPPWWSSKQIVEAAASAGEIVRTGRSASIVVVHGDPDTLASRLHDAGAIFVFGSVLFISCLS